MVPPTRRRTVSAGASCGPNWLPDRRTPPTTLARSAAYRGGASGACAVSIWQRCTALAPATGDLSWSRGDQIYPAVPADDAGTASGGEPALRALFAIGGSHE